MVRFSPLLLLPLQGDIFNLKYHTGICGLFARGIGGCAQLFVRLGVVRKISLIDLQKIDCALLQIAMSLVLSSSSSSYHISRN